MFLIAFFFFLYDAFFRSKIEGFGVSTFGNTPKVSGELPIWSSEVEFEEVFFCDIH